MPYPLIKKLEFIFLEPQLFLEPILLLQYPKDQNSAKKGPPPFGGGPPYLYAVRRQMMLSSVCRCSRRYPQRRRSRGRQQRTCK